MISAETINKYLKLNGLPENEGYSLRDKGNGNVIHSWVLDLPKPKKQELSALYAEFLAEKEDENINIKRINEYPPLGDFADAYVKQAIQDKEDGKTFIPEMDAYINKVVKVKNDNSKKDLK